MINVRGSGGDDRLRLVRESETQYLVRDHTGIAPGFGCVQLDPATLRCTDLSPSPDLWLDGAGGDDRVFVAKGVGARSITIRGGEGRDKIGIDRSSPEEVRLFGNHGHDQLTGGGGADALIGENGADRLSGGGGPDVFTAGRQPDVVLGGPGDDEIRAAAKGPDRDRTVDCGPGDDLAIVDVQDPPAPGCERVLER